MSHQIADFFDSAFLNTLYLDREVVYIHATTRSIAAALTLKSLVCKDLISLLKGALPKVGRSSSIAKMNPDDFHSLLFKQVPLSKIQCTCQNNFKVHLLFLLQIRLSLLNVKQGDQMKLMEKVSKMPIYSVMSTSGLPD